jgi:hypothetical protein
LQMCGRRENHFPAGDGHIAAKISVGEFGATVWELRRRTKIAAISLMDDGAQKFLAQ